MMCIKTYLRNLGLKKMKSLIPYFIFIFVTLVSCGKSDQQKAQDSLIGDWSVTDIYQSKNTIIDNGQINESQDFWEGMLGTFHFTSAEMDYEYIMVDTIQNTQSYKLHISKENSGFIRVNKYEIIGDVENFIVRYGDQTSSAISNATNINLEKIEILDSLLISTVFTLVKK